jgi:ParB family transcriptional regulator, chromosome partitioning protein
MSTVTKPRKVKSIPAKRETKPPIGETKPPIGETDSAESVSALRPLAPTQGMVIEIPLGQIVRHKSNRKITTESVDELRKSIESVGQLEPAHVRSIGASKYELLSGERRFVACQAAGAKYLKAIIVSGDGSDAIMRLAAANSNRKDLDPVERAELMQTLMKPIDKGGSGLTRMDAGRVVGLTSDSGVKNALRILKLPKEIQAMLRDGKLSERAARRLIPLADIAPVMSDVARELADPTGELAFELTIDEQYPWALRRSIEEHTRPMDDRTTSYRVGKESRWHVKKAFAGDADLPVREIEIDGKTWRFTTEIDAWEKMQVSAEKAAESKQATRGTPKPGKKGAANSVVPTVPEKTDKERLAEADERLAKWTRYVFIPAVIRSHAAANPPKMLHDLVPDMMLMHTHSECTNKMQAARAELGMKPFDAPKPDANSHGLVGEFWSLLLWPQIQVAGKKPKSKTIAAAGVMPDLDYVARQASLDGMARVARWTELTIADWWASATDPGSTAHQLVELWLARNTIEQLGRVWREAAIAGTAPAKRGELAEHLLGLHCGAKPLELPKMLAKEWAKVVG